MADSILKINDDISKFKDLEIALTCTQPVYGDGNINAKIVFIGEAPGKEEDLQGKPFVGRSGKLLNDLLDSIGINRDKVYITNIVKFRPPENRDPLPIEKEKCVEFLIRELTLIKPKIIVTLGRHSMNYFFPKLKISEAHGVELKKNCTWNSNQIFLPLYHPAVALYNPNSKVTLFEDFKKLNNLLKNDA